ncbi:MAG: response regulator transcription factor [Flavobacteriales bacterium]|nr:response regulator transcription factor [Flavobacteriales bacterium]
MPLPGTHGGRHRRVHGLSPNTVLTHRRKVYQKLGVSCRLDLYHRAIELGLVVCRCCKQRHAG